MSIAHSSKPLVSSPKPEAKLHKSKFREWFDSVLFAVVAATIIRWLFFSAFVIPTPSMENTLLVGEYLFTSRLHYGTTTPVTPLQIPLSHQTLWGAEIPSYLDWIKLPQFRLPGFSQVKRGDVIVFNLPVEQEGLYQKYGTVLPNLKPHPLDLRSNYIKRCVGVPGDLLEIKDGQIYNNGVAFANPNGMQNEYFVSTSTPVNELNVFRKNGITSFSQYTETFNDTLTSNDEFGYIVKTTTEKIQILKKLDFVKRVSEVILPKGIKEPFLFPQSDLINWNKDNYGPVLIPKEGTTVDLTAANVAIYGDIITYHENNENVEIRGDAVFIGGQKIPQYTFKQDYFFMMGDNRHDSADSRYWGFVPMDHIVGKAIFVWMSIDPDPADFWNKFRWSRIFRIIN